MTAERQEFNPSPFAWARWSTAGLGPDLMIGSLRPDGDGWFSVHARFDDMPPLQAPAEGYCEGTACRVGRGASEHSAECIAETAVSQGWAPDVQPKHTASEFTNELGNAIRITIEGPTSTSENVLTPMEADKLRSALNEHAAQAPAPAPEGSGAKLAPCPFCGRRPKLAVRPDNAEATSYFASVTCHCGGYTCCAYQDATAPAADEAECQARAAWNRCAQAPAVGDATATDPGTSIDDGARIFARVMEYQGKERRQVVNPCLTARECIALANYIAASGRTTGAES